MKFQKRFASILALLLAVLMLLSLLIGALASTARAARGDDLQQRLDELQERADENNRLMQQVQDKLDANRAEIDSLVEQKLALDQSMVELNAEKQQLNQKIQTCNHSIAEKQAQLDDSIAEREALYERYRKRLRAMEEGGTVSYWEVLFSSKSFSDLLTNLDMMGEIVNADQIMLDEIDALSSRIEEERGTLAQEKQTLEAAKDDLAEAEEALLAKREEADAYIAQIHSDVGLLNALFLEYDNAAGLLQEEISVAQQAYDEERAKLEEEQRKREEAAAAAAAAVSSNYSGSSSGGRSYSNTPSKPQVDSSGYLFPLPTGLGTYITDSYGYRWHPIDGVYKFHYGVDFAVDYGVEIYASKAGYVAVEDFSTYNGNYIKLQHDDGSMTYYLHLDSYAVSPGETVSQGQVIGYVGSTGASTGPHLHFQIMIGGEAVNPMDYITIQ